MAQYNVGTGGRALPPWTYSPGHIPPTDNSPTMG